MTVCCDRKRGVDSSVSQSCSDERDRKKKKCRVRVRAAVLGVNYVGTPLVSRSTGCPCDSVRLEADRPYRIGRSRHDCEFLLDDSRVSRQHCRLLLSSEHRKVFIVDGGCVNDYFSRNVEENEESGSLNGVFVNGSRCKQGVLSELYEGDEVLFSCAGDQCNYGVKVGFTISKMVFLEDEVFRCRRITDSPSSSKRDFASRFASSGSAVIICRANILLDQCRQILQSADPVYCIQRFPLDFQPFMQAPLACNNFPGSRVNLVTRNPAHLRAEPQVANVFPILEQQMLNHGSPATHGNKSSERIVQLDFDEGRTLVSAHGEHSPQKNDASLRNFKDENPSSVYYAPDTLSDNTGGNVDSVPLENSFRLNRLESAEQGSSGPNSGISLPELFYPVKDILQIFIATFTSDIGWFLSYCQIPHLMRVTIACHDTDRCWSAAPDKRTVVPNPEFPNVEVVFPPFPEAIAFGKDRKKQGIACHHPKLIVIQREDRMRVVISSANLVAKQWTSITNTVWWQDFPRRRIPDYPSLFNQITDRRGHRSLNSDFAAQLAGFMASLVIDASSHASWITELTKYDFEGATGYLVASVPGIHSYRLQYSSDVSKMDFSTDDQDTSSTQCFKHLGLVETSVVGLSYFFRTASDKNGAALKKLASFLSKSHVNASEMLEIVLRRTTNIAADTNAVSILVRDPGNISNGDCVQFGFLPRGFAKWVSPLWDSGIFRFSGYIYPKEVLAAALEGDNRKVQLILHIFQGPCFKDVSKMMQHNHTNAFCSLIASMKRCTGLSRLHEVLGQYSWPDALETDFVYAASSIGSSVNAQFLAAFSAAAGKKSSLLSESEESDPEWGCWTASQELKNPSIKIIFPTIDRVKNAIHGISPSRHILCFAESTWQRLRSAGMLHDAVPHPDKRIGHPMHIKVARRRFRSRTSLSTFGWIYTGSHNFSSAAWGRLISTNSDASSKHELSKSGPLKLHVCNYELGIILVVPPRESSFSSKSVTTNLDDIMLPFAMPAPKYRHSDRPATKQAMREAAVKLYEMEGELSEVPLTEETEEEIAECTNLVAEAAEENAYADMLWSKVESSDFFNILNL